MARRFSVYALLIMMVPALEIGDGLSGQSKATTSKKTSHKSQAASPSRTSPDVTSTVPSAVKLKQPAPPPKEDDESIPPPFNLPKASRLRMRSCGERWQAMKMSGEAGDQTWRAYATKCLASKTGPDNGVDKGPHP